MLLTMTFKWLTLKIIEKFFFNEINIETKHVCFEELFFNIFRFMSCSLENLSVAGVGGYEIDHLKSIMFKIDFFF